MNANRISPVLPSLYRATIRINLYRTHLTEAHHTRDNRIIVTREVWAMSFRAAARDIMEHEGCYTLASMVLVDTGDATPRRAGLVPTRVSTESADENWVVRQ